MGSISYKISFPTCMVSGHVTKWGEEIVPTFGMAKHYYDDLEPWSMRQAAIFRITEEEIDITKEEW